MTEPTPAAPAAAHAAPPHALPVGARVQEFEIRACLGVGGFGMVYLAWDTLCEREVAIKEYLPVNCARRSEDGQVHAHSAPQQATFEQGLRYFVSEARMLARFRHPALVEILRYWEAHGTAYMVMPYYRGRTLAERLQAGFRISDEAGLRAFLLPLLDGLAHLHGEHCYHRDISPDNILLLDTGQPVLLDFGAARNMLVDAAEAVTVILKPGFAPIEQYSDDRETAPQGAWTDLYALSAVAYQLVTGRMPTVSVARIVRDPLPSLAHSAPPGFSPGLLTAIDAGLKVFPAERPQSVQAFLALMAAPAPKSAEVQAAPAPASAARLEPIVDASPPARLAQPAIQANAPSRAQRGAWRGALLAGLLCLVAVIGLWWFQFGEDTAQLPASTHGETQQPALATVPAAAPPIVPSARTLDTLAMMGTAADTAADTAANTTAPTWPQAETSLAQGSDADLPISGLPISQDNLAATPEQGDEQNPPQDTSLSPWLPPIESYPAIGQTLTQRDSDEHALTGQAQGAADALALAPEGQPGLSALTDAMPLHATPLPESPTTEEAGNTLALSELQQVINEALVAIEQPQATLNVQVEPWGNVFVNGKLMGVTPPRLLLQLEPGPVHIEMRNETHPAKQVSLHLEAGRTYRVKHVFSAP